ncbi:lipopolysaccharide biosynthesis protein [Marinilabilia salmonicolor]|uniref:O-antigen/teichoic acid export membrane protein n=1 Tax=Marinilabilia salmonicolor TaxID=989 RepID=A0A368V8X9_9BACT|nr:lipopolysaccharide biosynthesis protein [Marinilabilia salmonicolor]RCW36725.1 O-antigen/teichoic acid export membrane protein [Marinilabilia salmonicolor]
MSLRSRGRTAIKWSLFEKFLKRGITFVVSMFLARLLEPSDFGLVAMVSVFTAFAEVFYDFGMGQALVQRKQVSEVQYSTVFYVNMLLGIAVYAIMWIAAPYIALFYENDILTNIVRVSSLTFIISSAGLVNASVIMRSLEYNIFAKAMVISSVVGGVLGIGMAYQGYGVWSLVIYGVVSSLVNTGVLWALTPWRPRALFQLKSIKKIWLTGLGFMNVGVINNVVSRIDNLFIGKIFDAATLGFFNRAKALQELPQYTFILPITRPMFPVFSQLQADDKKLQEAFFQMLHLLNFVILLIFGILYFSAKNWIVILYSDKWLESVPYLKILLLLMPILPYNVLVTSLLKGMGRMRLLTRLTILDGIAIFSGIGFGFFYGLVGYLYAFVGFKYVVYFYRLWIVNRTFKIDWKTSVISLIKMLAVVAVIFFVVGFFNISNVFLEAFVISSVFVILFVGISFLLKLEGAFYAKQELKDFIHRKKF